MRVKYDCQQGKIKFSEVAREVTKVISVSSSFEGKLNFAETNFCSQTV